MENILEEVLNKLINSELSNYKIAVDTGISDETIANYRKGKTKPKGSNLKTLAKYLGVPGGITQTNINGTNIHGTKVMVTHPGECDYNERKEYMCLLKQKDEQMNRLINVIEQLTKA